MQPKTVDKSAILDRRECCFSRGNLILLQLTDSCNQYCAHCMRDSGPAPVLPVDISMIRSALASALDRIQPERIVISGGEPTLVPNLAQLVSKIHGLGVKASLCTNATLTTNVRARELSAAGLTSVTVGVDGVGKVYDQFRRSNGGFARALRGIRAFVAAEVKVTINVSFHKGLVSSADDIAREFEGLGVNAICVTSPIVQGRLRRSVLDVLGISREQFEIFVQDLARRVDCDVMVRIPRCNQAECPSGRSVFAMNRHGELSGCPDVGAINLIDTEYLVPKRG